MVSTIFRHGYIKLLLTINTILTMLSVRSLKKLNNDTIINISKKTPR